MKLRAGFSLLAGLLYAGALAHTTLAHARALPRPDDIGPPPAVLWPYVSTVGGKSLPEPSTPISGPPRVGGGGGASSDGGTSAAGGAGPGRNNPSLAQKDKPASQGNTDTESCSNPATGQPVIIATGEKFKHEQDFTSGNSYGLELRRTHRSKSTAGKFFGAKWLSTYDYPSLQKTGCYSHPDYPGVCFPTSIVYTDTNGAQYKFTRSPGELSYLVNNSSAAGQLYGDGMSWSLYLEDRVLVFSFSGIVQQITDGAGLLVRRFEYPSAASSRPNRVLNRAGQAVQFTWSNNRVTQITDPGGNTWTMGMTRMACCPPRRLLDRPRT